MGRAIVITITLLVLLVSCKDKPEKEDLKYLQGYWEIERVVLMDGTIKEYNANSTIDFIALEGNEGYRKKVSPNLDGSYSTSDDAEYFKVQQKDGIFTMAYSNSLSEWREDIVSISQNKLVLVNSDNITYHYKKFEPIAIK